MTAPRIVVVGSVNADVVVKSARLPGPGETVTGGRFLMAAGGKGANQSTNASWPPGVITARERNGR
jgi:ribokinase